MTHQARRFSYGSCGTRIRWNFLLVPFEPGARAQAMVHHACTTSAVNSENPSRGGPSTTLALHGQVEHHSSITAYDCVDLGQAGGMMGCYAKPTTPTPERCGSARSCLSWRSDTILAGLSPRRIWGAGPRHLPLASPPKPLCRAPASLPSPRWDFAACS